MSLSKYCSKSEIIYLLELVNRTLSCSDEICFKRIMKELGNIIPYVHAISGIANVSNGDIDSYEIININYPEKWMKIYIDKKMYNNDPILFENYASFEPQNWEDTYKKRKPAKYFLNLAEDFGLRNGYAYGVNNPLKSRGSIFSFSSTSTTSRDKKRIITILKYIIPHFHKALFRILNKKHDELRSISNREKEIMLWLKEGKSSWDISVILGISERTVNFHIYNTIEKLGAVNRIQAVAFAVQMELIEYY